MKTTGEVAHGTGRRQATAPPGRRTPGRPLTGGASAAGPPVAEGDRDRGLEGPLDAEEKRRLRGRGQPRPRLAGPALRRSTTPRAPRKFWQNASYSSACCWPGGLQSGDVARRGRSSAGGAASRRPPGGDYDFVDAQPKSQSLAAVQRHACLKTACLPSIPLRLRPFEWYCKFRA